MNQTDSYHAGVAAPPYVFGALEERYPQTSQNNHVDLTSALEHLSNLPKFDAVNDTAFTLSPTSMGTFTNLTTPPEYAFPVSNKWLDHGYRLTLPRHRVFPILGPCGPPHVRPTPTSATILRDHRTQKLSQIQFPSPSSRYATPIGEGSIPLRHRT